MRSTNRQLSTFGVFILTGMVTLSGCATRKYVRQQAGNVETKLDGEIKDTNTKVTEAGERIDAVDRRAQQGIQAADQKATQAGTAASAADQKATNAQRTADTANQGVTQANNRITTVENEIATMDQFTAGPSTAVTFKTGSSTLSAEAKKSLDDGAGQVANMKGGYMVEVQGFTDSKGSENFNYGLSDRRAESVKRYLVSKNVQLHRISVVGVGKQNPVADNKTAKGRAENRRVEVRILKNAAAGRATN